MAYLYKHGDRPLDGYTIQRAVGRGGFGEVYYAISDGGREVALKVLRDNPHVELRGVSNCINLKSPHLVSIFDVRKTKDDDYVIIMEYISGPSLRDLLIAEPSGFAPAKAAFFCREIAKGLSYLHDRGIVHRDLKPGNIFYDDGYLKIGDYGLSKFISQSGHSVQTSSVGTVHYMAPEVGSGDYSRGIDIYAMGVIVYEMLRGRVPFEGSTMAEVLMKHLTSQPELENLPQPFGRVIRKALEKDPRNRFQTVNDMISEIMSGEEIQQSVAGFSMPSLNDAVARGYGEGPIPSPNPAPRFGVPMPAMPQYGPVGDAEIPKAVAKKFTRIDRMFENKLRKLGGTPAASREKDAAIDGARAGRWTGASSERGKRIALGLFLTTCLSVGLGVLFGATTKLGFEAGLSAALLVPAMAGGIAFSRIALRWFGAADGPVWTLRLIALCCSAPLLAIGASPMLTFGSEPYPSIGAAIWLGLLVVAVLRNWDAMMERAGVAEISFGSAVGTAIMAMITTGIASAAFDVGMHNYIFISASVAGVASLVLQASSWWSPTRMAEAASRAVATQAASAAQAATSGSGFVWQAEIGKGDQTVRLGNTPSLPPFARPLATSSSFERPSAGSSVGPQANAQPLERWFATRAFWSVVAFLLMTGGVVCLMLAIMMGGIHPEERTGLILGCSACCAFMLFAIRKTTWVRRPGFWRETLAPFLSSTAMFGVAALVTAIARHWFEMPDEGRAMSFAGLFVCFVLLGITGRASRMKSQPPFLVDAGSGYPDAAAPDFCGVEDSRAGAHAAASAQPLTREA